MSLENSIINFLFVLFLPFILLGLLGNMAGMKGYQSFLPVRLLLMAIWNLIVFVIKIIIELLVFFLASRSLSLGRKKVRIKLDK